LIIGPLAVQREFQGDGIGTSLMWQALDQAAWGNHRIVLLVGDLSFYGRFGFLPAESQGITLAGCDGRLLVKRLCRGALDNAASGAVSPWRGVRPDRQAA
jgi:predicted N-acetyltransferase YhbS